MVSAVAFLVAWLVWFCSRVGNSSSTGISSSTEYWEMPGMRVLRWSDARGKFF